jgi:putative CocE/NonD family hydrolase
LSVRQPVIGKPVGPPVRADRKGTLYDFKMLRSCVLFGFALAMQAAPAEKFDSHAVSEVMVPMRDGVKLATDLYRPARAGKAVEGRFPVILYRTPYNKAGQKSAAVYFAQHGYVVAAQDCRGRFASEGEFYALINEGKDGYDAIEWAGTQSWSNGKVGTLGGSYLGWDQYHASMYQPPHLTAMFALVGGANFYDEYGYPGGAPNLGWPLWILGSASSSPEAARNPAAANQLNSAMKDPEAWLAQPPRQRAGIFQGFPFHKKMYMDFYDHPALDNYWKQKGFYTAGNYKLMKDVPIYFLTGWYDYFGAGALEDFTALSRLQKTPKKMLVGPWPHGTGRSTCGDVFYGDPAAIDQNALALDWFDHWLKGRELQMVGPEPVRLFRMGGGSGARTNGKLTHGGQWRTASSWPVREAQPTKYYIHSGGALTPLAAGKEAPSSFVYDPEHPVPTAGGRYSHAQTNACAQDQGAANQRPDVLSFSTAPLESAADLTGKIRSTLWIGSDAVDTDFTAKLMDVYPNGYALILANGRIRTRYRESFEAPKLMKPGAVYKVTIDLGSTSNQFQKGHRIRLDISSSNYPEFESNPNTGEPAGAWTHRVKARNTVYHDAARSSYVELPLIRHIAVK